GEALLEATERIEVPAVRLVDGGRIGVDLDGAPVFALRTVPVPLVGKRRGQHRARLAEAGLQLQGLQRRGLHLDSSRAGSDVAVDEPRTVCGRQTFVRGGEARILGDGGLEVCGRLLERLRRALPPVVAAE